MLTEKPTAARKIATTLDERKSPIEIKKGKAAYFECKRGNDALLVVYALGHLYELQQVEKGWNYPRLESKWVPKHEVDKKATNTKPVITLIRSLSKNIDEFIVATDYDIEGSLIGYLTLKYACGADPSKAHRMLFSTLTETELQQAFDTRGELDFPLIEAGRVRHELDWLYGINMTRALTLSIKRTAGWFKVVSTGRVQGPLLAFIADREREISSFVPTPYWSVLVVGQHNGSEIQLEHPQKRFLSQGEAEAVATDLQGKDAKVEKINERSVSQQPNPPFNLSSLQLEAYRHLGFSPSRTLAIAQSLYLDALISYPRTNSEQLPSTLDLKSILTGLETNKDYSPLVRTILKGKNVPIQGTKTDPAHPAIHPTGEKPTKKLTQNEKSVYDLIVRRFLSLFGEPLVKVHIRVDIRCGNHLLYTRGLQIANPGWTDFYRPYFKTEEKILPDLGENDVFQIIRAHSEEKYKQAPVRFNSASLLKLLERENLGTKATRSNIIDSVKSRGYTQGNKYELSTLGFAVFETLDEYLPDILSPELTRQLEMEMSSIQENIKNHEVVVADAKSRLLTILEDFKSKEQQIGETLVKGLQRYWKDTEELGPCTACNDGTLRVIRSSKTGKRFVGCSNYKDGKCTQSFPLPQKGMITPLNEVCSHCGYPMIKVTSGRRVWTTCINWSKCPGRQEDLKLLDQRRNKKKDEEEGMVQ